jgi:hypothetical protein
MQGNLSPNSFAQRYFDYMRLKINIWGKNMPNTEELKYMHIMGAVLTQPLQKLAASAIQALCKCLMSKNVF